VIVRAISALEIADFARWSEGTDRGFAPEDRERFLAWLDSLWETGRSEPRLCLVVEEEHAPIATAVFWRHEDMAHVEHLAGSDGACTELLKWALANLPELGIRRVWAEAVTPPTSEERREEFGAIVEGAGLELSDRGIRFEIDPVDEPQTGDDNDLQWRDFVEVGRGTFIDAMARCTAGTLDPPIAQELEQHGPRGAAALRLDRLLALVGDRAWWQLAYSHDGDLVGMVLPSIADSHVINFVGVVPEWRRRGVATTLLKRGAAILAAAGATKIRADASSANTPVIRAFESAGFQRFATRHVWERALPVRVRPPVV